MSISQRIFDKYNSVVDDMISSDFGVTTTLYLAGIPEQCSHCTSSIYGGPQTTRTFCNYCNGTNIIQPETTLEIKLRVYYSKKDFIKTADLNIPDGAAQIIGFMSDVHKLKSATYLMINDLKYTLAAEPKPWGFKHNRYFFSYIKRA